MNGLRAVLGLAIFLPSHSLAQISGRPVGNPNLNKRIESADAIIVGKLISGTTVATGTQVSNDVVLEVRRVIKGSLLVGTTIAAHLEGRSSFLASNEKRSPIQRQIYGIWFLSESVPYVIIPHDRYGEIYRAAVVLPDDAPPGKPGATPSESVMNELVAGLRWLAQEHGAELIPVGRQNGNSDVTFTSKYSGEFRSLVMDLAGLGRLPLFKEFAAEKSPHLRVIGIQGLIAANDPEGVKQAATHWDELAAVADTSPISMVLIGYVNSDPAGARALSDIALRPNSPTGLHESATYALRAVHTKETLPALVSLLDDKSERVRSWALSGLCLFVRNGPLVTPQSIPSMSWMEIRQPTPFLNGETRNYCHLGGDLGADADSFVAFWKSWWIRHRLEIESQ